MVPSDVYEVRITPLPFLEVPRTRRKTSTNSVIVEARDNDKYPCRETMSSQRYCNMG